ncbi:MAG: hypothetical protein AB7V14_00745 [Kiritimatiellia bacterium]
MKQRPIIGWIIMMLLCEICFAVDPMEERVAQLATALNIATNAAAHISSRPVFTGENTIIAGEFQVRPKKIMEPHLGQPMDIDVLDTSGQGVAAGRVIEGTSFEVARSALLKRLVLNSMGMEALIQKYEVRDSDVGELCIVEKTFDNVNRKYTSDPAVIHFLRGGTAVSLYSTAKGKDLWAIAKTLDSTMSEISGTGKPLSIPVAVP